MYYVICITYYALCRLHHVSMYFVVLESTLRGLFWGFGQSVSSNYAEQYPHVFGQQSIMALCHGFPALTYLL
jgi:hypothetical protein